AGSRDAPQRPVVAVPSNRRRSRVGLRRSFPARRPRGVRRGRGTAGNGSRKYAVPRPRFRRGADHALSIWHAGAQLRQPGGRLGIARGAPVPAGGERAARPDPRTVGERGPRGPTGLEEPVQEHLEPILDDGQVVLPTPLGRDPLRPAAALPVPPRVVRQERDLARPEAEARDVVEVEVLELVRADDLLGALRRAAGRLAL